MLFWPLIILIIYLQKVLEKTDRRQFIKRKSISNSRSVEIISDKRLIINILPAQANEVERVKRFVNAHLHCSVSNVKK